MTAVPERLAAALADRYRIERELGAGGMATVYLAHDLRHERSVAIKVLRPEIAHSVGTDRFLREIRLAARLNHPNILPLFDSGDADGALFYVMPVVEGQSLRDRLARDRQLPVDEAVRIAAEVGGALDYAHRHGVVHRDIKPENILLQDGHALVADFGIGKALSAVEGEALTQTGSTLGTPAYMSPEQAAGDSVDGRSDIYSLGCVLYEMLVGEQPFTGPSVQAMIAKRFVQTPADVSALRAGVPRPVARTVQRALARTPVDRYETGAHFVTSLGEVEVAPVRVVAPEKSLAVLPFVNMSADPENEFFADGITEEIINALSQLEGLRVAARTSCFAFKGKTEDLRVIGDRLGVGSVLEGSVRKAGSRLRITAQLVNVTDGCHLWSERYDRELSDVFAMQDEIAGAIAAKLELGLAATTAAAPPRSAPGNLEAWELLLKGRVLLGRRGRAIVEARACLERAVALDPGLAEAHALLGDCFRLHAMYGIAPATEMMPLARASAERALALDPAQVEALATLANVTANFDWDTERANALTDRALALDPSHVRALAERASCVALRNATPEAMERALRDVRAACEIDPLNAWAAAMEGFGFLFAGRLAEALAAAQHAIELDTENFTARWVTVLVLSALGRHDEALAAAEPALLMSGRNPRILAEVAAIHAARGDGAAADAVFQEVRGRGRTGYIGWAEQGAIAASAGRLEEARALVQRAVEAREVFLVFWKLPSWKPLREDPEGRRILGSTGLW
jgi:eukaryotic-like serine/threonine-protein kinase